jgi:hypothetical protein
LDELAKSSQKFRNKMGIIDLEFMANETHMPVSECRSAILRAYPRSIFKGKYALARSEKFDTTFENILYKQLLFTENLTCAELLEGVRRFSTYRNSELLGEMNDFEEIVKLLTGSPPTLTKLKTQMLEETELSTTDQWLINCFQSQSKELIHRSEFVEMAIESGKNTGTILIYVLFNPLIRNCGHSVYSLIGTDISDEEVRVYAEIIRKNLRETELSYYFENFTKLKCTWWGNFSIKRVISACKWFYFYS